MLSVLTKLIINDRAPVFEHNLPSVTPAAGSNQVAPRHTKGFAYRCFLPDLTGFTNFRCAGPNYHHCLPEADLTRLFLSTGIPPCYSGLQVQGTATSPSSTVKTKSPSNKQSAFRIL